MTKFINLKNNSFTVQLQGVDEQAVCEELTNKILEAFGKANDDRVGLYLATPDAGIEPSVNFWQEAIEHGPSLVGPRLFPWTLANSPASYIGRTLGINGPTVTLVGDESLVAHLQEIAKDDLMNARVEKALVVYLSLTEKMAFVSFVE